MTPQKIAFLLCLVLLAMACAVAPLRDLAGLPLATSTATPSPDAQTLVPIDLHVGRGVRVGGFDLYFTDPADPASRQFTGGLDEPLVQAIDASRVSIHMAMFNLTLNNIRLALVRAHRRGVDVRLVTESDNLDGEDLQQLIQAGIPVLGDRRESIMHDKFMVIDGLQVWTGSMNYTGSGVYADNNCLVRIASSDLARAYELEFSDMFADDRFGDQGGNPGPGSHVDVDGTPVDVLFAPDDRPESELVGLLDRAQTSIEFLAFSFTSNALGDAMIRAQHAGVAVQGVMDEEQASSNTGTEFGAFKFAGLDVRLDGNPGQMHEKVLIIDTEIVVLGSYNFSRSANESNDENLLIIRSQPIASQLREEFVRIYSAAAP